MTKSQRARVRIAAAAFGATAIWMLLRDLPSLSLNAAVVAPASLTAVALLLLWVSERG